MTEPVLGKSIRGLNHLALVCKDMAVTCDFYENILGFPLVKTVELPLDLGQHFFFDITGGRGGATLAFFWFPNAVDGVPGISHPLGGGGLDGTMSAVTSMNHLAFDVAPEDIAPLRKKLIAAGVECSPIVNHDDSKWGAAKELHDGVFVQSVYFKDPDGFSLELAAWNKVFDESDIRHAPKSMAAAGQ
jgi:catechol 2,3-dioxygenase-like lactoylglutathione lyase family enzyme